MPEAISLLAARRESGKEVPEDVPSELVPDDYLTLSTLLILYAALWGMGHKL